MKRFEFDANTIAEAVNYMQNRAKQLGRLHYVLENIDTYLWGISALFTKKNKTYQSLYILDDCRGKGIFGQQVTHCIVTSYECDIVDYLSRNNIDHVVENLTPFKEYELISEFYGDQKAKRSGVYLMNHIDEGLTVLEAIGASETAKKAYCLHPILQSDEALLENYRADFSGVDPQTLLTVMEYRSVANEYLSKREISSIDEIRLSPLKVVNEMLIADKVQNRKDFELYHQNSHKQSKELTLYFGNWLQRLGVSSQDYQNLVDLLR